MEQPLTHHQNLEIEDILDKLYNVTSESDPSVLLSANADQLEEANENFSHDSQDTINLTNFHRQLLEDLSHDNYNTILDNLNKQFDQNEGILLHKASLVEQLVIRLQLDELNELQRAQKIGIV